MRLSMPPVVSQPFSQLTEGDLKMSQYFSRRRLGQANLKFKNIMEKSSPREN